MSIDVVAKLIDAVAHRGGALVERRAAMSVGRRLHRCSNVQRGQEVPERRRSLERIVRWSRRRIEPRQPGTDAPRPRVAARRVADTNRRGDRQRQHRRETREPSVFVVGECGRERATRKAHDEFVSERNVHVVPTRDRNTQREFREIEMLVTQQRAHQRVVDRHLCNRHVRSGHLPLRQCRSDRRLGVEAGRREVGNKDIFGTYEELDLGAAGDHTARTASSEPIDHFEVGLPTRDSRCRARVRRR